MKIFTMLDANCLELIVGFEGIAGEWKHRFSTDVLTKIDQGWMEVGNGNDREYGYAPCANCYMYAKSNCGDGRFCMNCAGDEGVETSFVNFEQIKKDFSFGYFDNFEVFKRYREVYNSATVRLDERMLKGSALFKEIQMLNLV